MNATLFTNPVIFSRLVVLSIIPFFLITGLIGNMIVAYIYARQSQKSNVETFILLLAVIDLVGCGFGMPLEMVELSLTIRSKYLCKLYKFVVFICCLMSSLILLIIAMERFRKICHPLRKQITPKLRQILIIFMAVTSVVTSLPVVFYTDAVPFSHELKACKVCGSSLSNLSVWSYAVAALIVHSILLLTMTVLYSFVQNTITQRLKKQQGKEEASKQEGINRTNIVLFSVSVLYFVSFSPTLVFCVIYPYCKDSNLLQTFKVVLFRTWILNASLNPVVYGFCNKIFRKSFVNIFTRGKIFFEMEEKF
uniref:G-protein coupled receptors family 1 profile domain-containing protein n=1 Tax=Octopus bimaculoides TaxID=37653 RepID=A0A0L8HMG6_OCTBM|eukprot:XP_014771188.1 PREDICTED: neuropeptide FF receptor 1-like [Octopus bimaculoides]